MDWSVNANYPRSNHFWVTRYQIKNDVSIYKWVRLQIINFDHKSQKTHAESPQHWMRGLCLGRVILLWDRNTILPMHCMRIISKQLCKWSCFWKADRAGSTVPRFGFNFECVLRLRRLQLRAFCTAVVLSARGAVLLYHGWGAHAHSQNSTNHGMRARACVCWRTRAEQTKYIRSAWQYSPACLYVCSLWSVMNIKHRVQPVTH